MENLRELYNDFMHFLGIGPRLDEYDTPDYWDEYFNEKISRL